MDIDLQRLGSIFQETHFKPEHEINAKTDIVQVFTSVKKHTNY